MDLNKILLHSTDASLALTFNVTVRPKILHFYLPTVTAFLLCEYLLFFPETNNIYFKS